jgi:hypothetical protein
MRPGGLFEAVPGGGSRFKGPEQTAGGCCDLIDGDLKGGLVGFGGLPETAHLAHELQRSLMDLSLAGGRVKVVEGLDIPAHSQILKFLSFLLLQKVWLDKPA